VVDLSSYLGYSCTEGVPQATIDALAANAGNYYIQLDSVGFPDGASRGQLALQAPTIGLSVSSWLCPPDMAFPPSAKALAKECGGMALPGQGFVGPVGYTSTGFAGTFQYDDRVQGPGGFDQDLSQASVNGGGTCGPQTHRCTFGPAPYEFNVPVGVLAIDPTLVPQGMKLGFTNVAIANETGVAIRRGPKGHLSVDMTGRYQGRVDISYYFTGSPKLAPPLAVGPTVDLAQAPVAADGRIALSLQYGATEIGDAPLSYEVQGQTDGHAYAQVQTTTKPFATVREPAGHSYRFRVRATDQFGVTSGWAVGSTVRLDTLQDTDPAIQYSSSSGGWTTAKSQGAYGGTTTSSNDSTASAQVTLTASEIALIMPFEPGGGNALLYFNGPDSPAAVSVGAATFAPRQMVFLQNFGSLGTQDLVLRPDGNGRVDLDAIVILQ
jgi:hypothetical protein